MGIYCGRVREIMIEEGGYLGAWISCPAEVIPAPGQYVLAYCKDDYDFYLGRSLFLKEASSRGFLTAPPVPVRWQPGDEVRLRGPLGRGFQLPENISRLVLVALGNTSGRLYPLAIQALAKNIDVVLFSPAPLPPLPAALEVQPLNTLPEAIHWADFIALDTDLKTLSVLRADLGLGAYEKFHCPAQVLIYIPMPCGGLADCGACAVPLRRGWKLACKDGPVFDLNSLEW
jgi:hypothetical protein